MDLTMKEALLDGRPRAEPNFPLLPPSAVANMAHTLTPPPHTHLFLHLPILLHLDLNRAQVAADLGRHLLLRRLLSPCHLQLSPRLA